MGKTIETEEFEEKKAPEVKLKSEMYNHDNETLDKREDDGPSDAIMWGAVIGFALFFVLLIIIIVFTQL